LIRNFLDSVISFDSKLATGSQQIFGVVNTTALVLSFPQILFAPTAQASKRKTLSFRVFADPWRLRALLEVLVPLSFLQMHPFLKFPRYFLNLLLFIFLYIPSSFFFLKPRFICLLQELRSHLTIPSADKPGLTFLGLISKPAEFLLSMLL
jgi:hypothetical protein